MLNNNRPKDLKCFEHALIVAVPKKGTLTIKSFDKIRPMGFSRTTWRATPPSETTYSLCMAASVSPSSTALAPNSPSIKEFFKHRTEQISLDEVVVLNTPDPTSVVPSLHCYLNSDHVNWIL